MAEQREDSSDGSDSESAPQSIPPSARSRAPAPKTAVPRVVAAPSKPAVSQPARQRPAVPLRPGAPAAETSATSETDSASLPAAVDDAPSALAHIVDDTDVSVPIFLPQSTGPRIDLHSARAASSLNFRRTLIPILLTLGLSLPLVAVWWFRLDPDAPMKEAGLKFPVTLLIVGAVMLALGVLNMAAVRQELSRATSETPRGH